MASLDRLLKAHEPYPALTLDRHWNMVAANSAVAPLLTAVDPELMKPPVNVLRVSLHPRGLAPLIVNLREWRGHLLERLRRQLRITRDAALDKLLKELTAYPIAAHAAAARPLQGPTVTGTEEIAVPLKLRTQRGVLSFLSTVTVFGTPVDITLSELTLEAFYPADPETLAILQEGRLPSSHSARPPLVGPG
jgi:hypothetical protein